MNVMAESVPSAFSLHSCHPMDADADADDADVTMIIIQIQAT